MEGGHMRSNDNVRCYAIKWYTHTHEAHLVGRAKTSLRYGRPAAAIESTLHVDRVAPLDFRIRFALDVEVLEIEVIVWLASDRG